MKESITHVGNAVKISLGRTVLLSITGQYMKESDILVVNANIKQLQEVVLLNTTGEHMKESDTLADTVANISLRREIWIRTKG